MCWSHVSIHISSIHELSSLSRTKRSHVWKILGSDLLESTFFFWGSINPHYPRLLALSPTPASDGNCRPYQRNGGGSQRRTIYLTVEPLLTVSIVDSGAFLFATSRLLTHARLNRTGSKRTKLVWQIHTNILTPSEQLRRLVFFFFYGPAVACTLTDWYRLWRAVELLVAGPVGAVGLATLGGSPCCCLSGGLATSWRAKPQQE